MTHAEFVQSLHDLANWFEARPELGLPSTPEISFHYAGEVAGINVDSREGVAAFARIAGGKLIKDGDDSFFRLVAQVGPHRVTALAYREAVCERIQVGTKIEPAHTLPAQEETFVPEREVPMYEYHCPSILAAVNG